MVIVYLPPSVYLLNLFHIKLPNLSLHFIWGIPFLQWFNCSELRSHSESIVSTVYLCLSLSLTFNRTINALLLFFLNSREEEEKEAHKGSVCRALAVWPEGMEALYRQLQIQLVGPPLEIYLHIQSTPFLLLLPLSLLLLLLLLHHSLF